MHIIGYLIAGLIAGLLAGIVMKGGRKDFITYSTVGVIGALAGGVISDSAGVTLRGELGSYIAASAGAVILLAFLVFLRRT